MKKSKDILPDDAVILTRAEVAQQLPSMDETDGVFTVPEGVAAIGNQAFINCCGIRRVILPESVIMICVEAFSGCEDLETINLPENLAVIGEDSFARCKKLSSISLPKKIKKIHNRAFKLCTGLTSVRLPAGLTRIGQEAFRGCVNLADINLPRALRVIEYAAFLGCASLERLMLPGRVSTVEPYAFLNCDRLELSAVSSDAGAYAQDYVNAWREKVQEERNTVILCCTGCGRPCASFPKPHEKELSWSRLIAQNCIGLKEKPIPGDIITPTVFFPFICKIGDCFAAAYGDGEFITAKLTEIVSKEMDEAVIRAEVLETGNRLSFVRRLSTRVIKNLEASCEFHYTTPEGDYDDYNLKIKQINDHLICLENDYGGGDITIVHYLYTDEDGVDHLTEIQYSDFHTDYTVFGDLVLGLHRYCPFQWENGFLINREQKAVWKGSADLTEAEIPEGIEDINMWAFAGCVELRTITLPSSVHRIDYCAIHECTKLKQIRIFASPGSFDEGNLRILLPDVDLLYCDDMEGS